MTKTQEEVLDTIYARAKEYFNDNGDKESQIVELLGPYLKIRSTHSHSWLMYGESLRVMGKYKEALPALKRAHELTQSDKRGFISARIGMLFSACGSLAEAEKWYEQAMKSGEKSPGWMWIFRGTNLSKMGEFIRAVECFRESLQRDEVDKEESYLNMGYALRAMGKYSEAIEAFQKALEINPKYSEAQSALDGLANIQETINFAARIREV